MTDMEVLKVISRMRRELDVLEEYIKAKPQEPKVPSREETEIRGRAVQVIRLLNTKLDTKFSVKAEKNLKHTVARLREGYKLQDFELVIDYKKNEWGNSDKMRGFLRPETLFGPKFDGYLNAARAKAGAEKSYNINEIEAEIIRRLGA